MKSSLLLVLLLTLVSCATNSGHFAPFYNVDVESEAERGYASGKTVKVVSEVRGIKSKSYVEITEKALIKSGFTIDNKNPDLIVNLRFAVGDPRTITETRVTQRFGLNTAQVNDKWGNNLGSVQSWGNQGQNISTKSFDLYMRKIQLLAVEKNTGKEVWILEVRSEGRSGNLKESFPYILSAGIPYIGINTNGVVNREVQETAHNIDYLRQPASTGN